ncbi:2-hydroxychromene-2-carboxylate isomerase [Pseudosulfitobacter sp. DSM 107133]|uniref:2-hydroxychromene-2-carboxylate isomerase n=1 Tax=Pseudosulfitobacter sp. DSM 107133 TaxID=2883100 RepID=UPI000DF17533|nr:2-hydroxychromene-2-carboxylate isomerase [Pseudosulfitobacter sp. DSM 107133]UOA26101.1 2-hydroxychromene-2-carboxylate isomerase [Pseudosulfitobacter sp. DSM 107133]
MTKPLEFWFEFASTYSYPAAMQIEAACVARGVTLVWRPFLLGPVFGAQGMTDSPFNLYPIKGAYMWRDMARICAAAELPLQKPSTFPRGSMLAARICAANAGADWIGDFVRAVYSANFAEDLDIGAPEVIGPVLQALGQDAAALVEQAGTPETKQALRALTDDAIARGIFGAPSFTVGDELFWGHDRMTMALDEAAAGN